MARRDPVADVPAGPADPRRPVVADGRVPVAGDGERPAPRVGEVELDLRQELTKGGPQGREDRVVVVEGGPDARAVVVGRSPPAEGDPVVDGALAVDDEVPVVGEDLAVGQTDRVPLLRRERRGGDHERVDGREPSTQPGQRRRPRLGGAHDGPGGQLAPVVEQQPVRAPLAHDVGHPRLLDDAAAAPAHGRGQPVGETAGVDPGAVRARGRAEHGATGPVGRGEPLERLVALEPAGAAVPPGVGRHLRAGPRLLGPAPGEDEGAAAHVTGIHPFVRGRATDLLDALAQRGEHRVGGRRPVTGGEGVAGDGEERAHPAAVAPARAEADVLGLEDDDLDAGLLAQQVVRGPQTRVPAADDRDVGVRGQLGRGRARRRVVPPQGVDHGARAASRRRRAPSAGAARCRRTRPARW